MRHAPWQNKAGVVDALVEAGANATVERLGRGLPGSSAPFNISPFRPRGPS